MKFRGPLVTLTAVAAVGAGMWLVNVSRETENPAAPEQASATAAPATPATPPAPPKAAFPASADYVGTIPTANGVITLDINVEGRNAVAYACDGYGVETWLRGTAVDGLMTLAGDDTTSNLEGRPKGSTVAGTLQIGAESWQFTAAEGESDVV